MSYLEVGRAYRCLFPSLEFVCVVHVQCLVRGREAWSMVRTTTENRENN